MKYDFLSTDALLEATNVATLTDYRADPIHSAKAPETNSLRAAMTVHLTGTRGRYSKVCSARHDFLRGLAFASSGPEIGLGFDAGDASQIHSPSQHGDLLIF